MALGDDQTLMFQWQFSVQSLILHLDDLWSGKIYIWDKPESIRNLR